MCFVFVVGKKFHSKKYKNKNNKFMFLLVYFLNLEMATPIEANAKCILLKRMNFLPLQQTRNKNRHTMSTACTYFVTLIFLFL